MKKVCSGELTPRYKKMVEKFYNPHFGVIDAFSGKVDEREFIDRIVQKEIEPMCVDCHLPADECGKRG